LKNTAKTGGPYGWVTKGTIGRIFIHAQNTSATKSFQTKPSPTKSETGEPTCMSCDPVIGERSTGDWMGNRRFNSGIRFWRRGQVL